MCERPTDSPLDAYPEAVVTGWGRRGGVVAGGCGDPAGRAVAGEEREAGAVEAQGVAVAGPGEQEERPEKGDQGQRAKDVTPSHRPASQSPPAAGLRTAARARLRWTRGSGGSPCSEAKATMKMPMCTNGTTRNAVRSDPVACWTA